MLTENGERSLVTSQEREPVFNQRMRRYEDLIQRRKLQVVVKRERERVDFKGKKRGYTSTLLVEAMDDDGDILDRTKIRDREADEDEEDEEEPTICYPKIKECKLESGRAYMQHRASKYIYKCRPVWELGTN